MSLVFFLINLWYNYIVLESLTNLLTTLWLAFVMNL